MPQTLVQTMDRWQEFASFLRRLRDPEPLTQAADVQLLQELADSRSPITGSRETEPRRLGTATFSLQYFLTEVPQFQTSELGLESFGLQLIPKNLGPKIMGGAFGDVDIAFMLEDVGKPLTRRHLRACKYQDMNQYLKVWTEVEILRSVCHPHIVQFVGYFAVTPGGPRDLPGNQLWIIEEYANAGDLLKEIFRYERQRMPESGIKYYALQIGSGLQYLHHRGIIHRDLSERNVLLKYNRDGSKTCLLCDFGLSKISTFPGPVEPYEAQDDIFRFCVVIIQMFGSAKIPRDARRINEIAGNSAVIIRDGPRNIDDFMRLKWFSKPPLAAPPFPKDPTPMLRPEVVQELVFLPQEHPTGSRGPPAKPETPESRSSERRVSESSAGRTSISRSISSAFSRTKDGIHSVLCLPLRCLRTSSGHSDSEEQELKEMAGTSSQVSSVASGARPPSPRVRHPEQLAVEVHRQTSSPPAAESYVHAHIPVPGPTIGRRPHSFAGSRTSSPTPRRRESM